MCSVTWCSVVRCNFYVLLIALIDFLPPSHFPSLTFCLLRWVGYIKDYDGGTLMECYIHPALDYLNVSTKYVHNLIFSSNPSLSHTLSLSLPLSLSLSHTHTHSLSLSLSHSHYYIPTQVPKIVAAQRAFIYQRLKDRSQ